jgi:hypothetical protein
MRRRQAPVLPPRRFEGGVTVRRAMRVGNTLWVDT